MNTVQHSSLCPLDPEPSPSLNVELENTEGKMGPELSVLTIGGGGDTTIPSPGRSPKQPLSGIELRPPTWSASLLRIQLISPGSWSNISPVGDLFVPSPPKTGTKLLHPLPPSIVERVSWRSSNHHQLVRVSRRPDSSVPRMRGLGRQDEPPQPVS